MFETVKNALRVSDDDLNDEIQDLIDAAKADLELSGIIKVDEFDPLIKRAIITYCKAHFGYDDMGERFEQAYMSIKQHLALSAEYTEAGT